jgi:hypothetical protein
LLHATPRHADGQLRNANRGHRTAANAEGQPEDADCYSRNFLDALAQCAMCRASAASGFSKNSSMIIAQATKWESTLSAVKGGRPRVRTFPVGLDVSLQREDVLDLFLVRKKRQRTDNRKGMARADHSRLSV